MGRATVAARATAGRGWLNGTMSDDATLPPSAPTKEGQEWKLPDTPLEVADRMAHKGKARSKA